MRLRIITSRPPGYRRGGLVIGGPAAPTIVTRDEVSKEGLLAIVRDPNLSLAFSISEDGDDFEKIDAEDREEIRKSMEAEVLRVDQADTSIAGLAASLVAIDEQAGFEPTPSQAASGAEGNPDGAAAPAGEPDAKVAEAQASVAVDPAGTSDASAASGEAFREQAAAASPDRKDAPDEGNQPEGTAQPPVADQAKPQGEAKKAGRSRRNA